MTRRRTLVLGAAGAAVPRALAATCAALFGAAASAAARAQTTPGSAPATTSASTASTAPAAAWPDRAQRWVVPFPPGGPLDVLARTLAETLQAASGQPIVIDNLPGAAGNLGIQAVQRAAGDGGTWLFVPQGNITINATLLPNTPFQWERDFRPVTLLATAANVLVAHPSVPARDVAELVALAKAQPGRLGYASPGVGSALHLIGELLEREAGIDLLHVPYKGTAQALQDLQGGQVQLMFGAVPTLAPAVKAGRLRALAVTTARRAPQLPEVPTLTEAGVAIDVPSWYGMMAPAATPAALIERAHAAVAAALATPAVRDRLLALGLVPVASRPADYAQQIRRETTAWARLIRDAGIKAE